MGSGVKDWTPCPRWLAGELPRGFITLHDAARRTGIPIRNLRRWMRRGLMEERGRAIQKMKNGTEMEQSVIVLADMQDYIELPKDGRGRLLSGVE